MKALVLINFAAMALLITACEGGPATFQDYRHEVNSALCDALFRCCTLQEAQDVIPYKPDEVSCVKSLDATFDHDWGEVAQQISAGNLRYDPSAASQCLDTYRRMLNQCEKDLNVAEQIRYCALVTPGTIKLSDQCSPLEDRCDDAFCVAQSNSDLGVCTAYAELDAPCSPQCSPGLTCLSSGICGEYLPPGATCDFFLECSNLSCVSGHCANVSVRDYLCGN